LLRRILARSPSGASLRSLNLERHQLAAAERTSKAKRQKRPVAPARQRVRTEPQHGREHIRCGRALAVRRGSDSAADAAEHRPHPLGVGRRFQPASLWRCAMAAARRPTVEALRPAWARSER
jgi:hypothetical protein